MVGSIGVFILVASKMGCLGLSLFLWFSVLEVLLRVGSTGSCWKNVDLRRRGGVKRNGGEKRND